MLNVEVQLTDLKLLGMARAYQSLSETRQLNELSLSDGLDLLLQAERDARIDRRYKRLKKNASFRYPAIVDQLNYEPSRGLDKSVIASLITGAYIENGETVLITGATGCGKSFLATALGNHACQQGFTVQYQNMQKLMIATKLARIAATSTKFFDRLANVRLLIVDDFGLAAMDNQQRLDFLEILEDRHGKNATIIASQIPVASWFDVIGEPTIADAILDRIIHTSHRIELKGESLRKKM